MSKYEDLFKEAFTFWFPGEEIQHNTRPPWLRGLEIDIFLPDRRVGFEVQGAQHYLWTPHFQTTPLQYLAQRRRDVEKRSLCAQRSVHIFVLNHFDGVYQKLRGIFPGHKFPIIPTELQKRWTQYRQSAHHWRQESVAFKVKAGGVLIPINRASSDWLKSHPAFLRPE